MVFTPAFVGQRGDNVSVKTLWEMGCESQRKQFQQNTLRNFNLAVEAAVRLVPKDEPQSMDAAMNYMLDAVVQLPVMVLCSWAGHAEEQEASIIAGIKRKFADVRERAKVSVPEGETTKEIVNDQPGEG